MKYLAIAILTPVTIVIMSVKSILSIPFCLLVLWADGFMEDIERKVNEQIL
jgi:hypothetical protein